MMETEASQQVEDHVLRKYRLLEKVGSGSYGHVWKAEHLTNHSICALKKVYKAFRNAKDAQRTYRELSILLKLPPSKCVVRLQEAIRSKNQQDLYLVFDYADCDLYSVIQGRETILNSTHYKYIIYQMAYGLRALHNAQVLHRDMKPANVLINSDCSIYLCDFGLSRFLKPHRKNSAGLNNDKNSSPKKQTGNEDNSFAEDVYTFQDLENDEHQPVVMTEFVSTRWYRSPEILFGSKTYGKPTDIWSLGCVIAELLTGKPIFGTEDLLQQIDRIISFTGAPTHEDIEALQSPNIPNMDKYKSGEKFRQKLLGNIDDKEAADLVCRLLVFNPKKRLTAEQILAHPYLKEFRNFFPDDTKTCEIQCDVNDNMQLRASEYRKLVETMINEKFPDNMGYASSKKMMINMKELKELDNKNSNGERLNISSFYKPTVTDLTVYTRPAKAPKIVNNRSPDAYHHSLKDDSKKVTRTRLYAKEPKVQKETNEPKEDKEEKDWSNSGDLKVFLSTAGWTGPNSPVNQSKIPSTKKALEGEQLPRRRQEEVNRSRHSPDLTSYQMVNQIYKSNSRPARRYLKKNIQKSIEQKENNTNNSSIYSKFNRQNHSNGKNKSKYIKSPYEDSKTLIRTGTKSLDKNSKSGALVHAPPIVSRYNNQRSSIYKTSVQGTRSSQQVSNPSIILNKHMIKETTKQSTVFKQATNEPRMLKKTRMTRNLWERQNANNSPNRQAS